MLKRLTSFLIVCAVVATNVITPVSAIRLENNQALAAIVENEKIESSNYEIYPLPQSQSYLEGNLAITDEVNVVVEENIDDSTKNFINEILGSKSITGTISEAVVADKTNILIGTRGSKGYVDAYFDANIQYNGSIYEEEDAYVLRIDEELEGAGTIAILGKDTDSAYYGLATLKMILSQIEGKEVKAVQYEDFADGKWRGFIEGFYGFPWSNESRMDLMKFGGEFKMNSYIYAPKDEPYHNSKWREPYPADKLAEIAEMVEAGKKSKCEFVWAIHPGMNMINFNNYDAELATLLAKLDQLYSVGVRQFGLFMDDISTSQSLTDKNKHVKLITDVANWVAAKGDCDSLVYCPPFYNQSWTGETGKPYLQALSNVPENVEIMWTGRSVCGTVNEADLQWVKDATGRDPYMWLNWPVNDYKDSRLMLGKGEVMTPGTHNLSGIVTNPMGHPQLSKVALFAVADFTWNSDDFNDTESWMDSFKYITPEVADEFNTIAYHLSDPSPSGHGLVLGESENIKAELELVLDKFNKEQELGTSGTDLISEFDEILSAIEVFRSDCANEAMLTEITPWLNCLQYVVEACKSATKSAIAVESGDIGTAWEELAKATSAIATSKTFIIKKYNYPDVVVEAGSRRLVPFANELIGKLDSKVYTNMDPEAVVPMAISSYGNVNGLGSMIDGNDETSVYIQTVQKNGDWFGVDFGKSIKVNDVRILNGRNNTDHDRFQRGVLEYSVDGENFIAIGDERSDVEVIVNDLDIEARYVRYRLTHAGIPGGKPDLWTGVREFTVNKNSGKVSSYTNVSELKETGVTSTGITSEITNLENITLEKDQYIGIKLLGIDRIAEISLEASNSDLSLEVSENGVEWSTVEIGGDYPSASYVRLINKTESSINFNLSKLSITLNKFTEPELSHNYPSIYQGALDNMFDGNLDTRVWFGGMQDAGKFVQVDLGGIIDVENLAVVIGDGEGDFFRKGDLQISLDGETWETVNTFNNPEDKTLNFPDHEVPYRYKRVDVGGKKAKYVRLISTENNNVWFAINEIIVNEGMERPGTNNPAFDVNPQGGIGYEALFSADKKLATFYTPEGDATEGHLSYKFSDKTNMGELIILQSPTGISNAKVSVRDQKGWNEVGTLSQSYNLLDTSKYENVLEVKVEWDGSVKPVINEIIAVERNGEVTPPEEISNGKTTINVEGNIKVNTPFDATVGVSEIKEGLELYASDFIFTYDPEVFNFNGATKAIDGLFVTPFKVKDGEVRVLVSSLGTPILSTSDLVKMNLTAKKATNETSLAVNSNELGDGEGAIYELEATNTVVKVEEEIIEEIVVSKVDNLKSINVTSDTVELAWDDPKRTVGLVEYVIYKDGKVLETVPVGTNTYSATKLKANTIYGFKVTAKYSNDEESKPKSVNVRTKKAN
ncbi:MAG: beta-N-acetylglucosaminidase domain-containing protein [Clostridium sp.]